jgi:hypothetical protein
MPWTYILTCADGSHCVGSAHDLARLGVADDLLQPAAALEQADQMIQHGIVHP